MESRRLGERTPQSHPSRISRSACLIPRTEEIIPRHRLPLLMIICMLAACTVLPARRVPGEPPAQGEVILPGSPPGTPSALPPTASPVEELPPGTADAIHWLADQPFRPGSEEPAEVLEDHLPEGFRIINPVYTPGTMPGGGIAYLTRLEYQSLTGDQVYAEDAVQVQIFSYDALETRTAHLEFLAAREYEWEFASLGETQIVRYYTEGLDGRAWISGPHLLLISSGSDPIGIGPWLDTFTALYLERYPAERQLSN